MIRHTPIVNQYRADPWNYRTPSLIRLKKPQARDPIKDKRVMGIEPTWPAWKAGTLPLSYTRNPKACYTQSMAGAGFEPAKALPPDLQSGPFGRSGIPPTEPSTTIFHGLCRHRPAREPEAETDLFHSRSKNTDRASKLHPAKYVTNTNQKAL